MNINNWLNLHFGTTSANRGSVGISCPRADSRPVDRCSRIFHQAHWQTWCAGKTWLTSLEIGSGGCLHQFRGRINILIQFFWHHKRQHFIKYRYCDHHGQHVVLKLRNRSEFSDKMPKIMMMHPTKVPTRVEPGTDQRSFSIGRATSRSATDLQFRSCGSEGWQ